MMPIINLILIGKTHPSQLIFTTSPLGKMAEMVLSLKEWGMSDFISLRFPIIY
jgi:hypothetical protein